MDDFRLTVVMPAYNEGSGIQSGVLRTAGVLDNAGIRHDFILVDDGSADHTWDEIEKLMLESGNIKGIRLSRNFGKESAICAGLAEACGDCCVVIDADMQHPPEYIPEMVGKWKNEGCMVVEGVKAARGRENIFKKMSALLFYRTLNAFCGIDLRNASDFRLLDRKAVDAWKAMPERETFFRAMSTWIGYKRGTVSIDIEERKSGVTSWSRSRLMRLAVSAITSFSSIPLYIVTAMGFIFLVLAMALGIQTIVKKFTGASVEGFTTVILLLLIIGSILMISLGIIGIYIARIYDEVKHRPRYLIERIEGGGKDHAAEKPEQ